MKKKACYTNPYLYLGLFCITFLAFVIYIFLIEGTDKESLSPSGLIFVFIGLILVILMVYFDKDVSDSILARFGIKKIKIKKKMREFVPKLKKGFHPFQSR